MRAAWFVARSQLRARWGSVVVLTLIVGITGAVVLASLAGARRTSSSFERFRDTTLDPDLTIFAPTVDDATIAHLRARPGVEGIAELRQLTGLLNGSFSGAIAGRFDRDFLRTVGGARLLDGRLPRQDRIEEVAVPEPLAQSLGLEVGDTFSFEGFTPEQVDAVIRGEKIDLDDPEGPKAQMRVVGVVRSPQDLSLQGAQGGVIVTTRAFTDRYADQIGSFAGTVLVVRTTDDDAARRFVRAARAEVADLGPDGEFQVVPTSESRGAVQDSIDVVATGLVVFGLVAALAGLVVVAVVVRRFVDGGAADLVALRGLGVSRRGRALTLALPLAPVAVLGATIAVVGAWLASPIFPLGLARKAEPHLGLHADGLVLALGFGAGVVLVAVLSWVSARLTVRGATREHAPEVRPAPLSNAMAASSPAVRVGVAAATNRSGTSAPALPAVAGTVVAVAGILAVAVIPSSLRHLERTPSAYGYNWDAHVVVKKANRLGSDCSPAQVAVADDRAVAAAADLCSSTVEIEGYSVTGTGFMPLVGDVGPTVLEGHAPRTKHEVALGTTTFSRVHTSIGDSVQIAGPSGEHTYRIVGRVALPVFSTGSGEGGDIQAIADGAAFTGAGLARIEHSESNTSARVLLRWRDGVDVRAAKTRIDQLRGGTHRPLDAQVPLEVDRLQQIHVLPWLLGAFLVVIGVLGLGFGLVSSTRRRAREIAVLKTIGFRRAQVEVSVAVQATAYGVLGSLLGVPLGVIVGRATWHRIATNNGFAVRPTVSLGIAALVIVGAMVLANVVAWFPARRAARLKPAVVLRSE
jgi:ABC-type lipoprotein release transport system permease subunit